MEGKQKGFTLIELLVTFAIVIILALVSVPLYEELIAGGRVKGASESLYFFILKVRSDAIKTQTTANLVFQSGSTWCFGATTASTCNCTVSASCNLGQFSSSDYSNVTLSVTGFVAGVSGAYGTSITGTRGMASSTGTVSFAAADGDSVSVILNAMGFVRICSANVVGYKTCS
jgi:type IV fimbrial biogenesis protein FimT